MIELSPPAPSSRGKSAARVACTRYMSAAGVPRREAISLAEWEAVANSRVRFCREWRNKMGNSCQILPREASRG